MHTKSLSLCRNGQRCSSAVAAMMQSLVLRIVVPCLRSLRYIFRGLNESDFRHGRHNQGPKIAPDPRLAGVIGHALLTFLIPRTLFFRGKACHLTS